MEKFVPVVVIKELSETDMNNQRSRVKFPDSVFLFLRRKGRNIKKLLSKKDIT